MKYLLLILALASCQKTSTINKPVHDIWGYWSSDGHNITRNISTPIHYVIFKDDIVFNADY